MKKKQILVIIFLGTTLMMPLAVGAQTSTTYNTLAKPGIHRTVNDNLRKKIAMNTVAGTVASIDGMTLTMTDKKGTTYTVDASAAKILVALNDPSIIVTSIQSGDKIFVTGAITGTSIVAKAIRDQSFVGRIIFNGKVTAATGNSITINFRKTPYVIDASAATITAGIGRNTKTITAADIKVGDMITAVGTLNSTTIAATSIHDLAPRKRAMELLKNKFGKNPKNFQGAQ